MWHHETTEINNGMRYQLMSDGTYLTFAEVIRLWKTDRAFRDYFIALLTGIAFSCYRWETPPVTTSTINRAFEFVVIDDPSLCCTPDTRSFSEHFTRAEVVEFSNLGHDAILIVPCPHHRQQQDDIPDYSHLAAFLKNASGSQKHALWQQVGLSMSRRVNKYPVWLSTAGAGVSWLHIRLDDRPKYYLYQAYRSHA